MKEYKHENLNIKRLLELGDLDIRGIAAQNGALTADKYFSKVEQFLEGAPQAIELISGISTLEENLQALKALESKLGINERSLDITSDSKRISDLEELKNILTDIGYTKINADLDGICSALSAGNLKLAEKLAGGVMGYFALLLERTKSAHTKKKFAKVKPEGGGEGASTSTTTLTEALEYLDYEEETRKLRVLAVDDVSVVLNTITSVLSPYYEVFALKNSSQVEKFLTGTTPELFLLDIEMNEVNGFDLVPLIRKFKKHKDTPIIFLTGNASLDNLKDAISVGACDFITKPIDRNILLEKIKKNIVRKKAY